MSTSLFNFLFHTDERRACRSELASAVAQHELATVITQATAESLQSKIAENQTVRRAQSAHMTQIKKEIDSGERAAVECGGIPVAKHCSNCIFYSKLTETEGMCTHPQMQVKVQALSKCELYLHVDGSHGG